MKKCAMIGVGKLGQDCAEVMAEKYELVGYDVEPRSPSNFRMANSIQEAVTGKDIIFVAVPTPHHPGYGGETPTSSMSPQDFDLTILSNVLCEINRFVERGQLVVLISTVLPGTCRSFLRQCVSNARFVYNPYLIAMGTVKWDMVNPEMVIIGTDDGTITGDAKELIDFYRPLMQNNPRYEVGTWDEAEAIKIFYNTFISAKLSIVNMIQDVAEANGFMNVDVVTKALADSNYRITGPAYMTAGMGDGGACHPRDNIALRWMAQKYNLGYDLFGSIMESREVQAKKLASKCLENGKKVTIIGKAYKPKVPYTHGSYSLLVGYYINELGGEVRYYDPNTNDCDMFLDWTDVYLIGYHDDWFNIDSIPADKTIIDPWRKIGKVENRHILNYGDSKSRNDLALYTDSTRRHKEEFLLQHVIPEFNQVRGKLYMIYAGAHPNYPFHQRTKFSVASEMRQAIIKGREYFLFHCEEESMIKTTLDKLHEIIEIIKHEIDLTKVYFVTGAVNAKESYDEYCRIENITDKVNIIGTWFFEKGFIERHTHYRYTHGEYETHSREYLFLCYNRLHRQHRISLLEKCLKFGLFNKSYYSFFATPDEIKKLDTEKFPLVTKIADQFPITLGLENRQSIVEGIEPVDEIHFNQSVLSVVTESVYYKYQEDGGVFLHVAPVIDKSRFFTEKIFKPILMRHPFILVSRPHSLKKLRERGYLTFDGIIDESYDDIEDDELRLEAIAVELDRISKLNEEEMDNFRKKVKPIVEYNKRYLFANNRSFNEGVVINGL